MKQTVKPVLILFIIGTLVSAQQVSSENIFIECEDLGLERLVITTPELTGNGPRVGEMGFERLSVTGYKGPGFSLMRADTLETFDIELEEDEGKNFYKELAVFIIVAAMVGYMLVTIIKPDEEEETDTGGGKDFPGRFAGISIPLNR